jgi:hypothetical protein
VKEVCREVGWEKSKVGKSKGYHRTNNEAKKPKRLKPKCLIKLGLKLREGGALTTLTRARADSLRSAVMIPARHDILYVAATTFFYVEISGPELSF